MYMYTWATYMYCTSKSGPCFIKTCFQWQVEITVVSYWHRGIWLAESRHAIEIQNLFYETVPEPLNFLIEPSKEGGCGGREGWQVGCVRTLLISIRIPYTKKKMIYRICRRKGRSIFGWEKIKKSGSGVYATTTKFSGQNITSICMYGTIWTVAWLDNGTGQF